MKLKYYFQTSWLKTLFFNFRNLPFSQAVRLPVIIFRRSAIYSGRGKIVISAPVRHSMIKIGRCDIAGYEKCYTVLRINGYCIFKGKATIGAGSVISVDKDGILSFGKDFRITAGTQIMCGKAITFGDDVLISWDNLFMDSDRHCIFNAAGELVNEARPIRIGDHVWIGCRNTVLKGVNIPAGCVVAANSTLTRSFDVQAAVIGGKDQRVLKRNIFWKS